LVVTAESDRASCGKAKLNRKALKRFRSDRYRASARVLDLAVSDAEKWSKVIRAAHINAN